MGLLAIQLRETLRVTGRYRGQFGGAKTVKYRDLDGMERWSRDHRGVGTACGDRAVVLLGSPVALTE